MNFIYYDLLFLVLFGIFLAAFFIPRKKKLHREGLLFLYKTKLGLKAIDYIGVKYKKFLNVFSYFVTFVGYCLMAGMVYMLGKLVFLFLNPAFVKAVKIPPIAPLIPYLPQIFKVDYLPPFYFAYWIIVLGITAICHEFFHGIFAKARGVDIKSTGFAFLGPFAGAFVEPDEKKVKRLKVREQLGFLSAGSFANVLVFILFFFILWGFFTVAYSPSGMIFVDYTKVAVNISDIDSFGNNVTIHLNGGIKLTEILIGEDKYLILAEQASELKDFDYVYAYEDAPALRAGLIGPIVELDGTEVKDYESFRLAISEKKPYQNITLKTIVDEEEIKEYNIQLSENPLDRSKAYLGISIINSARVGGGITGKIREKIAFYKNPNTFYKPNNAPNFTIFIYNLLIWIVLVNFSVALVNMLPVGIFDGGRVFFLTMLGLSGSKKFAKSAFKFSTYLVLFVFLYLTYLWVVNTFIF